MLYDAMQYAEQVNQRAKAHRREKDLGGAEFLSGVSKEDKLVPVITLVILFDSGTWDGPKSLHEMFSMQEKELREFISDYKRNLMASMSWSMEQAMDALKLSANEKEYYAEKLSP